MFDSTVNVCEDTSEVLLPNDIDPVGSLDWLRLRLAVAVTEPDVDPEWVTTTERDSARVPLLKTSVRVAVAFGEELVDDETDPVNCCD